VSCGWGSNTRRLIIPLWVLVICCLNQLGDHFRKVLLLVVVQVCGAWVVRVRGQCDECYLVLFHTHLFMFVRPLALLIFNNLTCFVCFVINRPLHHVLIEGANMDMK
jgi:hypothetical protein